MFFCLIVCLIVTYCYFLLHYVIIFQTANYPTSNSNEEYIISSSLAKQETK